MLEIGSLVDNKYKILHEIGKGGMSHVYLAIDESSNKEWAIKEIKKKATTKDGEVWHKPMTETALMKTLRHEHLPEIADVLENNDAYHALKFCGGLIFTGPTGTNVNDVTVGLIGE